MRGMPKMREEVSHIGDQARNINYEPEAMEFELLSMHYNAITLTLSLIVVF